MHLFDSNSALDLIALNNIFRAAQGKDALSEPTAKKMGKAKLTAQIIAGASAKGFPLDAENIEKLLGLGSLEAYILDQIKQEKAAKKAEETEAKTSSEKPRSIRSVAEEYLKEVVTYDEDKRPYGLPYQEVLEALKADFPNAKTTIACLRWYVVRMKERGERVPARPRHKKA